MAEVLRAELERQVTALIKGGQAHAGFKKAVEGLRAELRGVKPVRVPYSAWQLVEHMRIAQRDILDFCTNGEEKGYSPRAWPEDYWPRESEPPSAGAWDEAVAAVKADRAELVQVFARASESELTEPVAWGDGQTVLREALLVADHTAYHVGELVLLRRSLGEWR